mmetsp:Transcript_37761/g.70884  ORF Transcript_37761/g.70884 Transcript_37761/m.70884 type:complete len:217 (+) Transcript_37761:831-1481(+)
MQCKPLPIADLLQLLSAHRVPPPWMRHNPVFPWSGKWQPWCWQRSPPPCMMQCIVLPTLQAPRLHPASAQRLPPPCSKQCIELVKHRFIHPSCRQLTGVCALQYIPCLLEGIAVKHPSFRQTLVCSCCMQNDDVPQIATLHCSCLHSLASACSSHNTTVAPSRLARIGANGRKPLCPHFTDICRTEPSESNECDPALSLLVLSCCEASALDLDQAA